MRKLEFLCVTCLFVWIVQLSFENVLCKRPRKLWLAHKSKSVAPTPAVRKEKAFSSFVDVVQMSRLLCHQRISGTWIFASFTFLDEANKNYYTQTRGFEKAGNINSIQF